MTIPHPMRAIALLCIAAAIAITACGQLPGQPGINDAYQARMFRSAEGDSMAYRILAPEAPADTALYPLVVFLHGSGEKGYDNKAQLKLGASVFSNPANMEQYPAYVVFPQCSRETWIGEFNPLSLMPGAPAKPLSTNMASVIGIIDETIASCPIDTNRIYIMGISMGGIGVYDLASRHPERIAAAVVICGAFNPDLLPPAAEVPFMIFHGEIDPVVPTFLARDDYRALKKAGADARYIEFSGTEHDSWHQALNHPDLLPWLFSQSK